MKFRLFNLEFNIFHNLISKLSFHFQSLCVQKDFHLFILASITYLHLNALLSPPASSAPISLLSKAFSPLQSPLCLFFFFASYSVNFAIFLFYFIIFFSFFNPSECWQSSGSFVLSSCLVGFLWLILLASCSQLPPPVNGSYCCISSPNICLEEYWFFNGATDLSCRYLRLKVFKADLQKWEMESCYFYILNTSGQFFCFKRKKSPRKMKNLECRKFRFMKVKC